MRSCGQVWAMGRDLEALGGKEIPGHTGDELLMMIMTRMVLIMIITMTMIIIRAKTWKPWEAGKHLDIQVMLNRRIHDL